MSKSSTYGYWLSFHLKDELRLLVKLAPLKAELLFVGPLAEAAANIGEGASGCEPDAHPTLRELQPAERMVSGVLTYSYCKLGSEFRQKADIAVGGGVGRIVHFGKLPVNMYTQFFRNAERPEGTTSWSARFQLQFLFPKR